MFFNLLIFLVLKFIKTADLSDLKRAQIVGAHMAGASVTIIAELLV